MKIRCTCARVFCFRIYGSKDIYERAVVVKTSLPNFSWSLISSLRRRPYAVATAKRGNQPGDFRASPSPPDRRGAGKGHDGGSCSRCRRRGLCGDLPLTAAPPQFAPRSCVRPGCATPVAAAPPARSAPPWPPARARKFVRSRSAKIFESTVSFLFRDSAISRFFSGCPSIHHLIRED